MLTTEADYVLSKRTTMCLLMTTLCEFTLLSSMKTKRLYKHIDYIIVICVHKIQPMVQKCLNQSNLTCSFKMIRSALISPWTKTWTWNILFKLKYSPPPPFPSTLLCFVSSMKRNETETNSHAHVCMYVMSLSLIAMYPHSHFQKWSKH